jgi:hypothetical protein
MQLIHYVYRPISISGRTNMYLTGKYVAVISALLIWVASPSWAEVSADQVWDDIIKRTKSAGYTVSAIQSRSDGTLILSELAFRSDNQDQGYSVNIEIGDMQLVPNNDGSVTVTPSKNITWDFLFPSEASDTMPLSLKQTARRFVLLASGDKGQIKYDYSAERIDLAFDEFVVQEGAMKSDQADLQISLVDVIGKLKITGDLLRETLSSFSAASIDVMARFDPKKESYKGMWKTRLSNVSIASTGQVPDGYSLQDASAALSAGYNNSSVFRYQTGETNLSFSSDQGKVLFDSSSADGTMSTTISSAGLKTMSEMRAMEFAASGNFLPNPMQAKVGSLVYVGDMPVIPFRENQPFGVRLELNEVIISDLLWTIVDPLSYLPHGPLTLKLDIHGMMQLLVDFMSSDLSKTAPSDLTKLAQIGALSLNSLLLSGFGAEVEAEGAFEFDSGDFKTFGGLPRPKGKAKVKLTGINTLLEKVVKMGIIGSQQAMAAQMGIGIFALPIGDDILQTELEIDQNGSVFANGQQLR